MMSKSVDTFVGISVKRSVTEPVKEMATHTRTGVARHTLTTFALGLLVLGAAACTPTVKVATDEPITINLNVNIKHEILVKVDKELDDLLGEDSDLF